MFRDSADPSAAFADVIATPGNGVTFQWAGWSSPGLLEPRVRSRGTM